jgi:hypothetical protein
MPIKKWEILSGYAEPPCLDLYNHRPLAQHFCQRKVHEVYVFTWDLC